MEKLFTCHGAIKTDVEIPSLVRERLCAETKRHIQATINKSLEKNNAHFKQAREKLEKWADDQVSSVEKELSDTKEKIKLLEREARQAATLEEQKEIQEQIQKQEKQKRRQRLDIFKAEDEILERRDKMIDVLEKRLAQKTNAEELFLIRWEVV